MVRKATKILSRDDDGFYLFVESKYISDVILENPAYGGTNRIDSDQTPRVLRGV